MTPFDTTPPATPFTDVHDLAWSPDGTKLAYSADQADATRAIVVDDGTTQTVLTLGESPGLVARRARGIAFARRRSGCVSVAADGTDIRTLGDGRAARLARRPGRDAEVPESRAAAAERARRLARRQRALAPRLHVDGRQPRPGHRLDSRHARARART